MNKVEFAKRACEFIDEISGCQTTYMFHKLEIPENQQQRCRQILNSLAERGVLNRMGQGKFRWSIKNKEWDRDNPLRTPRTNGDNKIGMGMKGEHTSNQLRIYGNTYEHRQRLGALGCEFARVGKYWWMPWERFLKRHEPFANLLDNYAELTAGRPEVDISEAAEEVLAKNTKANGVDMGPVLEKLLKQVDDLEDQIAKLHRSRKVELTVKLPDQTVKIVNGRVHPVFEQVMFHINCGDNVMLVGPKGCGKTVLAQQVATALERKHGILSLSGGVTESKLFGRVVPNVNTGKNEYHGTLFVELFEAGGVFLLDEVDAADPNVLLSINSGLANGILALDRPKQPLAKRHKEFVCLAAANTWGNGADRQYVGRNQQDSAFTERFVQIAMDYDEALEIALCPGAEGMVERMHKFRKAVVNNRLERSISTRFIVRAFNWLKNGKDQNYIDEMLFNGWREDEVRKVKGN